ncbi:MAG TPA: 2-amino-4-hydroxy-6-hydroxymethyldihydropteridine diphosphokinase [Melioribacteraceae bacterium]|nr:2-amino-4-hydroxy-6-hydroxymethyldihydropteridine diphosphokinase [Melioribacteraceae bacterium]
MENRIYLGLGSNKGDRLGFLIKAIDKINDSPNCNVIKVSAVYESSPLGNVEQPDFLNAAIEISTGYSPEELFGFLKMIETGLGRKVADKKWGPREIDIDILFYNQLIYDKKNLVIPHTEILKRDFVILPLIEIAPGFSHPVINKRLMEINLEQIEKHVFAKFDFKLI